MLDVFVGELRVEGFDEFGKLSFGFLEPAFERLLGVGLCDGVQSIDQKGSAPASGDHLAALGLCRLRSGQDDHAFVVAQLSEAGIAEGGRAKFFSGYSAGVTGVEDHDHLTGIDAVPPGGEVAARNGVL